MTEVKLIAMACGRTVHLEKEAKIYCKINIIKIATNQGIAGVSKGMESPILNLQIVIGVTIEEISYIKRYEFKYFVTIY